MGYLLLFVNVIARVPIFNNKYMGYLLHKYMGYLLLFVNAQNNALNAQKNASFTS